MIGYQCLMGKHILDLPWPKTSPVCLCIDEQIDGFQTMDQLEEKSILPMLAGHRKHVFTC